MLLYVCKYWCSHGCSTTGLYIYPALRLGRSSHMPYSGRQSIFTKKVKCRQSRKKQTVQCVIFYSNGPISLFCQCSNQFLQQSKSGRMGLRWRRVSHRLWAVVHYTYINQNLHPNHVWKELWIWIPRRTERCFRNKNLEVSRKCPTACANKPTESRQNYNQNLLLHTTLLTYKVQVSSLAHCSYVIIFCALPDPQRAMTFC